MKKWLDSISIKLKIVINSLILLTFLVSVSIYSLYSMNRIGEELDGILEHSFPYRETEFDYRGSIGTGDSFRAVDTHGTTQVD